MDFYSIVSRIIPLFSGYLSVNSFLRLLELLQKTRTQNMKISTSFLYLLFIAFFAFSCACDDDCSDPNCRNFPCSPCDDCTDINCPNYPCGSETNTITITIPRLCEDDCDLNGAYLPAPNYEPLIDLQKIQPLLEIGDEICTTVQLYTDSSAFRENTINGASLYAQSKAGIIELTRGTFDFTLNGEGEITGINGKGSAQLPRNEQFNEVFFTADTLGANVQFGSGAAFKAERPAADLALIDNNCYLKFELENKDHREEGFLAGLFRLNRVLMDFDVVYIDINDPGVYFDGTVAPIQIGTPIPPLEQAGSQKIFRISNTESVYDPYTRSFGFSWNNDLAFEPKKFSDRLEQAVGGTGIPQKIEAGFIAKGSISDMIAFRDYDFPIRAEGSIFTRFGANLGDFFQPNVEVVQGISGSLQFGEEVINRLPEGFPLALTNAVGIVQITNDAQAFIGAGNYNLDTRDLLQRMYLEANELPIQQIASEGEIYLRFASEKDDWEVFLANDFEMKLGGLSTPVLINNQYLHLKPEGLFVGMDATLPDGIGEIALYGQIDPSGNFELKGNFSKELAFRDDNIPAELEVIVTNEGIQLSGVLNLPEENDISVAGALTDSGISLRGADKISLGGYSIDLDYTVSSQNGFDAKAKAKLHGFTISMNVVYNTSVDRLFLSGEVANPTRFTKDTTFKLDALSISGTGTLTKFKVNLRTYDTKVELVATAKFRRNGGTKDWANTSVDFNANDTCFGFKVDALGKTFGGNICLSE